MSDFRKSNRVKNKGWFLCWIWPWPWHRLFRIRESTILDSLTLMSVFATRHLCFFIFFYLIAETNGHVTDLKWCYWHLFIQVKMSQVKQVGLLAAGCQPWNKDVCAASGDRFAYCATLAIYVYQVSANYWNVN